MLSHKKGKYAGCYLPLTQANVSMAQTLFLNKSEVNNIQESYLMLWGRNQGTNFVLPTELLNEIDRSYEVLLKKYFSKQEIYFDEFFMFICVFIFYEPSQLFNLLLSICNIHSNIFISKGQLNEISKIFNGKIVSSQFVNILNNCSKNDSTEYPPNTYSVKTLSSVINTLDSYKDFFFQLKNQLINLTISSDMYFNIVKRRKFYCDNGISAVPPPEPCFSKLIRNAFSKTPSPYHFDFYSSTPNQNGLEEVLFLVRQRFGYSSRRSSYVVNSIPLTRSSKSLKSPDVTISNNSHHGTTEIKHRTTFSSKVTSNQSSRYKSCPDMKQTLLMDVTSPKEVDMNNYEVNQIFGSYLTIWSQCQSQNFIPLKVLAVRFHPVYRSILKAFFTNEEVHYDDYYLFVCLIVFCEIDRITSVLLSLCEVKSNLFITYEQIVKFVKNLDEKILLALDLSDVLNQSHIEVNDAQVDTYSVKSFQYSLSNSIAYQTFICQLRGNILDITLGKKIYTKIVNRRSFFIKHPNSKPPKESCTSKIYRMLFTNEPNPYYYDFISPDPVKTLNDSVVLMRQGFGYAERKNSTDPQHTPVSKGRPSFNKKDLSVNSRIITVKQKSTRFSSLSPHDTHEENVVV